MHHRRVVYGLLFLGMLSILVLAVFRPFGSSPASWPIPPSPSAATSSPGPPATPTRAAPYPGLVRQATARPPRQTAGPAQPTSTRFPKQPPTYAPPTPTPTWPIVVPSIVASPTATRPPSSYFGRQTPRPTLTAPPEWADTVAAALAPLPAFAPVGAGQAPPVEWQTLDLVRLDVDGDPQEETLWFYLLRPIYEQDFSCHYVYGYRGLALLDDNGDLLWCSEPVDVQKQMGDLGFLAIASEPVVLAPGVVGVLSRKYEECCCNGAYRNEVTTFYYWDGANLQVAWGRPTAGGGKMGAGYGASSWESVEVRDVDGAGWPELLLQHAESMGNSDYPPRRHYTFYLPGAVAFRWDGEAYVPGYFVADGQLAPLRPRPPLYYAPRFSVPPTIDGHDGEWWQVEYREDLVLFDRHDFVRFDVAWDEHYLYLYIPPLGRQTFFVGLDADLAGDLDEDTLNADDVVWKLEVSGWPHCTATLDLCAPHLGADGAGDYQLAAAAVGYGCAVEFALPREWLGLAGADLVPEIGWVGGEPAAPGSRGWREYHPRAGRVVGFMVGAEEGPPAGVDLPDDPTTWATLVFIADR